MSEFYQTVIENPAAPFKVLLVHHAGGNCAYYYRWHQLFKPIAELTSFQLPRLISEESEGRIIDYEEACDFLFEQMREKAVGPWVYYGHSMGAYLGLGVIRRFEERTTNPPQFAVFSGARAPKSFESFPMEKRSHFTDAELCEELRIMDGVDPELLECQELLDLILPMLRADFRICEDFSLKPRLSIRTPLLVYSGREDQFMHGNISDWRESTDGECSIKTLPGGHFFIHTHIGQIIEDIRERILS